MSFTHTLRGLLALPVLVGCGTGGPAQSTDGERPVIRDSAGIRIVESQRPAWEEEEAWRISPEPLFIIHGADGSQENQLLDPTTVDVDPHGRIIIADGDQVGWDAVLVYDSAGEFLFRAGGPGQGPGEFGQLWWASAYRGDSIIGYDMRGNRVNVYAPTGSYARQVELPPLQDPALTPGTPRYTDGIDAAFGSGHFLAYPPGYLDTGTDAEPVWFRHELLRLSPDGERWDTLGTFEIFERFWDGSAAQQYWFGRTTVTALGPDYMYFGRGDGFEIGRYDTAGRLTDLLRRAYEPRPVTNELKGLIRDWYVDLVASNPRANDEMVERVRQQFRDAVFAPTLPPYSHAMLDPDGNLWVEEYGWMPIIERAPVQEPARWSVFDPEGVWLGAVETPPGLILRKVTRDRALGFRVDEMGVKEVYVHALERPGG